MRARAETKDLLGRSMMPTVDEKTENSDAQSDSKPEKSEKLRLGKKLNSGLPRTKGRPKDREKE